MLHSEWISKTRSGALTPRSTLLRAFDSALKLYELSPNALTRKNLDKAWADWKRSQSDPSSSVRNASGAVTEMEAWMAIPMAPKAPPLPARPTTSVATRSGHGWEKRVGGSVPELAAALARSKRQNQENAEYRVDVPDATQVITYQPGDPYMKWDNALGDYKQVIATVPTPVSFGLTYHFGFISRGPVLEVRVRARLKGANGYTVTEQTKSAFKTHIEATWNVATIVDGLTRYDVRFVMEWVDGTDGYEIDIDMTPPPPPGLNRKQMAEHSASKTIDMSRWGDTDRTGILHEFGHMIGNPDEYTCTGFTKTGHVWSAEIYNAPSYSTNSIMNNPTAEGRIHVRHFYPLLMHYKAWQTSLGYTPQAHVEIANNISVSSVMSMAALNRRRAMGYDD
jgi:hypothetical protein